MKHPQSRAYVFAHRPSLFFDTFLWGGEQVFQYVDLRQLAENAEREGIDMRVIYLRRSAKDMLFSNIVHRRFEE